MKKTVKQRPPTLSEGALNINEQAIDDQAERAKTIKASIVAQLQHRESKIRFKVL